MKWPDVGHCLILAAGKGTRLLPVTNHVPKPLFPLLNVPAIERLVTFLARSGTFRLAINIHHLKAQMLSWADNFSCRDSIIILEEEGLPDTGGAIKNAFDHMGYELPMLIYNADILSNIRIDMLIENYMSMGAPPALLCLHDRKEFNKIKVQDSSILSFCYNGPDALAFTGIAVVSPELFRSVSPGAFPLIQFLKGMIERGVPVMTTRAETLMQDPGQSWIWYDIGTPSGYLEANFALLSEQSKTVLVDGADMGRNVRFEGRVCIGKGAVIGDNVVIRDSVIWPEAVIPPRVEIRDCVATPYGFLFSDGSQKLI